MIFGLAAAAAFYVTKGQLWIDIKNGCISGSSNTSPNPNYEEIGTNNSNENGERHSLLLEQGGTMNESASVRASISKARESLHGSGRDLNFKSVIY